jgi:hypothetical protein
VSTDRTANLPPDLAALEARIGALEAEIASRERSAADPIAGAIVADLRSQVAALQRRVGALRTARTADLVKLHVARKELGIDADIWGLMVQGIAAGRTASSGGLTAPERAALLEALLARGFKPRRRPPVRRTQAPETKEALTDKVRALLLDAGRPDAYADAIARKRFAVERWEWLPWDSLLKLTQMLAIDQRRRARRAGPKGAA